MLFDNRPISPQQLGEITKVIVTALAKRSHAEGSALMDKHIGWHVKEFLDEQGDFNCDWVETGLTYPQAYTGLRPIQEQIELIADQFRLDKKPAMSLVSRGLPDVPKWAEGWAAFPISEEIKGTYASLVYKALIWHSGVSGNRPGYYCGSGAPEGLKLEEHVQPYFVDNASCTRRRFAWDWKQKIGGRIMIVPVQMGALRKGQSDRMVKAHCSREGMNEFPLGIFEVACLLAMHPQRIPKYREKALYVNTPGDKYTHAGFLKTANCRWKQMGNFWCFEEKGIPCFGFGQDNRQDEQNGPVTASRWDFDAILG